MVGTLEEYVAKKMPTRVEIQPEDELSDMDRVIIGLTAIRFLIPVQDVFKLRRVGEMLIALGERLKALSYQHDKPKREQLFLMASELRDVRDRIRLLHSKGRQK